jgi:hypothetical protein
MPRQSKHTVAVLGIDIGKNTFHLVGLNKRGAIVLRHKLSRHQLEAKLVNLPPCLIGMEACVGAHHLSCRLKAFGHDARLMPAKYVKAFLNETATYCSATRDRGADHLSVSPAVRGDRSHFKAIRLSWRRGSR